MSGRGEVSYHDQVVRQAAWVATNGEALRRVYRAVTDPRDRRRLEHVIDALEMGHIVVPEELAWVLELAARTERG